jgi:hypothetical protein
MAINIDNYDGTPLTSVTDGLINTTAADISFIGKGYELWGKPIQENLLWILQNFAGADAPANPVLGQLWYDTNPGANIIKVWIGSKWISSGGIVTQDGEPNVENPGALWYDTLNQQLKVSNGTIWQVVGPLSSSRVTGNPQNPPLPTNSAIEAIRLEDSLGVIHQCWRIAIGGVGVAIISKDLEFIPVAPFSTDWPIVYPGITLSTTVSATVANNKLIDDLLPAEDTETNIGSAEKRIGQIFSANLQVQGTSYFNNLNSPTAPPMRFVEQLSAISSPVAGAIEFINGTFNFTNRGLDGQPLRQVPLFEDSLIGRNRIYVSTNGSDINDGSNPGKSVATIKRALSLVKSGDTIFVEGGEYEEYNPLYVPPFVSIVGDNLRRTIIRPKHDQLDLFHVEQGSYFYGMTFKDHRAPAYCFAFPCSTAIAELDGGEIISVSPLYSQVGYDPLNPPAVFVEPPPYGGTQARYNAVVVDGAVVEIIIENEGQSYSNNISVSIEGTFSIPAQFRARVVNGRIKAIDIINPGSGYQWPTYTPISLLITDLGGSGSQAVANAYLADGVIQRYDAVSFGSGYAHVPHVSVNPVNRAFVTSSPYVQNCSSITGPFDTTGKLITSFPPYDINAPGFGYTAVDPNGAGAGIRIDGEVCSDNTVIRSFVADSFTQINQGGIGHLIINRGYAQFVSCFTTFSSVGYWARSGGFANISNSVIDFGDIGLRAEGYYPDNDGLGYEYGTLANSFSSTVATVILSNGGQGYQPNQEFQITFIGGGGANAQGTAYIDGAGEVNNIIITDNGSGYTNSPEVDWSAGDALQANPAVPVTRPTGVVELASPSTISIITSNPNPVRPRNSSTMLLNGRFYTVVSAAQTAPDTWTVETNPVVQSGVAGNDVRFYDMSNLSTGGLALEYVGSGVTYNALPFYGGIPNVIKQVEDKNSPAPIGPQCDPGVVYYVTIDNTGNFKIGNLFGVNFADGSVSISSKNFNLTGLSGIGPFKRNGVIVGTRADEISNDPSLTHPSNPAYDNTTIVTQSAARNYFSQINSDILPSSDNTRSLGSTGLRWNTVYGTSGNFTGIMTADTLVGSLSSAQITDALGYTPVQQGGGTGQDNNKIYIGWLGSSLGLQVDTTNFFSSWPISITGTATTANFATSADGLNPNINLRVRSLGVGMESSGVAGEMVAAGDIVAFATSDSRLKENLEVIPNALDKVSSLTGYTFNWNALAKTQGKDVSVREVGVIAQDVKEVLPEVVTIRDNGMLAVRYEKLVPLLIEAIKELRDEVQKLKEKSL